MQHPALQLRHLLRHRCARFAPAFERAEQIAERVAQAAVVVRHELQRCFADALVLGIVAADHHPQAQDVGAVGLHHVLRRRRVAERLRHLAALLVEREAVRHHRLVGRAAARAAGFQQRGMEPAAMLVRAFEIDVGRPGEVLVLARLQAEGVGRAGIEPDIDDVLDLLELVRIVVVAEEARRRRLEPGIGAFAAEGVDDALHHLRIAQQLAALLVDEDRDRHAPGALARDHQSGRCAIMECSRVLPCGGTKRVSSIAFSATSRRPLVAIEMNHCGVLRKISGAFDRQECG